MTAGEAPERVALEAQLAHLAPDRSPRRTPPGRRLFLGVLALSMFMVGGWFLVGEPLVAPLAEAARRHTAESRVKVHREAIALVAAETDLAPELIAAIIFAESSGRVDAHSSADAYGLMQLRLPTAREQARKLGLDEPTPTDLMTNPLLNIRLGAHYFLWVLEHEEDDVERSLVAYNAGRARLAKWIDEYGGTYASWKRSREEAGRSSTLAYANKVLATEERFRDAGIFASEAHNPGSPDAP